MIWSLFGEISIEKDRELSYYIVNHLPLGLKGILLAGVLSAAMSTLSSSINSLSSSTIADWCKKNQDINKARKISLFWAFILMGIAIFFDESNTSVIEMGLTIASYTYGGLLGLFLISRLNLKINSFSIISGLLASLLSVFVMKYYGIAFTWCIFFSVIVNVTITLLCNKVIFNENEY